MLEGPIYGSNRILSDATIPGQIGPVSNDKRVLCIPQSSPSDCLVSYPEHLLREFYPSAEMQSVYSVAQVNRAKIL